MKNMKDIQYVIEKIDGMSNADLVVQYKNGKKVGQKVIPIERLKAASSESATLNQKKQKKTKIVYVQAPTGQQVQQPIMVEKQAGFGTYLMQGFGLGLGLDAAGALFNGVDDAFGGSW